MTPQGITGRTRIGTRVNARTERFRLQRIASSLTPRDVQILLYLYDHKVLTTEQIYRLCFTSQARTQDRLLKLLELELIRRTRPRKRPGSLPYHYILDTAGALVVAEHLGIELRELDFRSDRRLGLIESPRLCHLRDLNTFFSFLIWACRTSGDLYHLKHWHSEEVCRKRWDDHITPDGMGVLEGPEGLIEFLLELDRGTENHNRLEQKIRRYRIIAGANGAPRLLLFCFNSAQREARAREALDGSRFILATTSLDRHRADPLGSVWRPLRADYRVRLTDLGRGGAA
ncbi:MAG: replication-relaxation family protein [Actinomycetota bacterium]